MVPGSSRFESKVVLVTGAGSGIGLATAKGLAAEGAIVILVDRDSARLEEHASTIPNSVPMVADVSDTHRAREIITNVIEQFGKLDALVLSAGINGPVGKVDLIDPDEVRHLLEVNVIGVFNYIQASVSHLEQQKGSITLVGSINGTRSFSWGGASPYIASKAAVQAMGRALAVELGPRGVRVNTVCPGSVDTQINVTTKWRGDGPAGRPKKFPEGFIPLTGWAAASADDVAQTILFLTSDMASHISGTEIFVDGGQSLI